MSKNLQYYKSLNYQISLEYNEDEGTWTAFNPEFGRGVCYTTHEDKSEAIRLLEEDRNELLELLIAQGINIPEPQPSYIEELPSGNIPLRITKHLHLTLKSIAANEGVSLNQFISNHLAQITGQYIVLSEVRKSIINQIQSVVVARSETLKEFEDYFNFDPSYKSEKITAQKGLDAWKN